MKTLFILALATSISISAYCQENCRPIYLDGIFIEDQPLLFVLAGAPKRIFVFTEENDVKLYLYSKDMAEPRLSGTGSYEFDDNYFPGTLKLYDLSSPSKTIPEIMEYSVDEVGPNYIVLKDRLNYVRFNSDNVIVGNYNGIVTSAENLKKEIMSYSPRDVPSSVYDYLSNPLVPEETVKMIAQLVSGIPASRVPFRIAKETIPYITKIYYAFDRYEVYLYLKDYVQYTCNRIDNLKLKKKEIRELRENIKRREPEYFRVESNRIEWNNKEYEVEDEINRLEAVANRSLVEIGVIVSSFAE